MKMASLSSKKRKTSVTYVPDRNKASALGRRFTMRKRRTTIRPITFELTIAGSDSSPDQAPASVNKPIDVTAPQSAEGDRDSVFSSGQQPSASLPREEVISSEHQSHPAAQRLLSAWWNHKNQKIRSSTPIDIGRESTKSDSLPRQSCAQVTEYEVGAGGRKTRAALKRKPGEPACQVEGGSRRVEVEESEKPACHSGMSIGSWNGEEHKPPGKMGKNTTGETGQIGLEMLREKGQMEPETSGETGQVGPKTRGKTRQVEPKTSGRTGLVLAPDDLRKRRERRLSTTKETYGRVALLSPCSDSGSESDGTARPSASGKAVHMLDVEKMEKDKPYMPKQDERHPFRTTNSMDESDDPDTKSRKSAVGGPSANQPKRLARKMKSSTRRDIPGGVRRKAASSALVDNVELPRGAQPLLEKQKGKISGTGRIPDKSGFITETGMVSHQMINKSAMSRFKSTFTTPCESPSSSHTSPPPPYPDSGSSISENFVMASNAHQSLRPVKRGREEKRRKLAAASNKNLPDMVIRVIPDSPGTSDDEGRRVHPSTSDLTELDVIISTMQDCVDEFFESDLRESEAEVKSFFEEVFDDTFSKLRQACKTYRKINKLNKKIRTGQALMRKKRKELLSLQIQHNSLKIEVSELQQRKEEEAKKLSIAVKEEANQRMIKDFLQELAHLGNEAP